LTRIIRQQWPWIPVILASGYADLPETDDAPPQRLAKPFTQAELARCIAFALEEQKIVPIDAGRRA
ncbi:MAG TPA: hypothetical protein VGF36_11295, partial [Rhodopila sp.]